MTRFCSNWLMSYMKMVEETEPSKRFHLWTAITIIAAMLGRKCEIEFGPEIVHPNLYTILTGPPGSRKSVAIKYGTMILDKVMETHPGVANVPDVITRQAFFQQLQGAETTDFLNGKPFTHSSLFVVASELVTFFQGKDIDQRLADLCALYDGKNVFEYKTKTSGQVYAIKPSVWILGATTPNWIQISMPQLAVGGGMTSRTIFVVAVKKGRHISYTKMPSFDNELKNNLIYDLTEIRKMIGEFSMEDKAKQTYDEWYEKIYPNHNITDPRLLTYVERLPSMVIKVAMVNSAAKSDSKVISELDLRQAIGFFDDIHRSMPLAFGGHGMSKLSAQTNLVKELLRNRIIISEAEILATLDMHVSGQDLQQIKETLTTSRFCSIDRKDGDKIWMLSEKEIKKREVVNE